MHMWKNLGKKKHGEQCIILCFLMVLYILILNLSFLLGILLNRVMLYIRDFLIANARNHRKANILQQNKAIGRALARPSHIQSIAHHRITKSRTGIQAAKCLILVRLILWFRMQMPFVLRKIILHERFCVCIAVERR